MFHTTGGLLLHSISFLVNGRRCAALTISLQKRPWSEQARQSISITTLPELLVRGHVLDGPQFGIVLLPVTNVFFYIVDQFILETLEVRRTHEIRMTAMVVDSTTIILRTDNRGRNVFNNDHLHLSLAEIWLSAAAAALLAFASKSVCFSMSLSWNKTRAARRLYLSSELRTRIDNNVIY